MNKKGYDYAALLLLVVIIGLVMLFVQIQTKFNDVSTLGKHQTKILNINNEVTFFESYLKIASKEAFDSALLDVLNAKIVFSQTDEVKAEECTIPRLPKTFEPELTNRFNYYLKPYLSYLGEDEGFEPITTEFLVGLENNDVIVSAVKPVKVNFVEKNGQFIYRPIVTINRANKLNEYASWVDTISTITKMCNKSKDPIACSETFTSIMEWKIQNSAQPNIYYLIIPLSTQEMWGSTVNQRICFAVNIEKSSSSTSEILQP